MRTTFIGMRSHANARRSTLAFLAALTVSALTHAQIPSQNLASPLVTVSGDELPANLRGSVTALAPDELVWKAMEATNHVRLQGVPVSATRQVNLVLQRIEPFTADARIVAARINAKGTLDEQVLPRPQGQWWGGTVEGDPRSKVMLSRSAAGILGFVQDAYGTAVITGDRIGGKGPLLAYQLGELPPGTIEWEPWTCQELTAPIDENLGNNSPVMLVQPCRQIRIAVETDAELFQRFAGSPQPIATSSAYIATVFAGIQQIYQRDLQILPAVNFLRLWPTADDPWTQDSAGNQLYEFRTWWQTNMTAQPRELATMLSTRGLGGGVAWLNVACNQDWGYSVSGNLAGAFPYPLINNHPQNWDIMVTSHELGHNIGSVHTHDFCPEPGDSCAPPGYFGSCQTAQACIATGTIMSYCHTCSGGMTNVLLDFHPLCIDAIGSYMSNSCNTGAGSTAPVTVDDWCELFMDGGSVDVDVLANDVLANCEAVVIDSFEPITPGGGVVMRLTGAGPGGRDVLRYTPAFGFVGTDRIAYQVREESGQVSPLGYVNAVVIALRLPDYPVGDTPGLTAYYYALTAPEVLPDFTTLSPYLTTTSANVNYSSTTGAFANSNRSDDVGAVWNGWLKVDQPGNYQFSLTSDDGSRLRIGGASVVDNNGLHGMQEAIGSIALAAGKHRISIEFFEAGGGAGCIAQLQGPGMTKAPIPASRFTKGGTLFRFDLSGDGRVNGVDLGMFLGLWGSPGGPADFNFDGIVDGADLAPLLSAWSV